MPQYRPEALASQFSPINRRLRSGEFQAAVKTVRKEGSGDWRVIAMSSPPSLANEPIRRTMANPTPEPSQRLL